LEDHDGRRYRQKPFAVFEHGTRIYAPTDTAPRYRVVATTADGARVFHKAGDEAAARAKARELERFSAEHTPITSVKAVSPTLATLTDDYLDHVQARSRRYRERQDSIIRCWVLPHLGALPVTD
jgi:hypothetical protein